MFTTGVGCPDVFAEPVVVHLVDLVDQDETWFGEIIGRRHNQVPQASRMYGVSDLACDEAFFISNVFTFNGKITPQDFGRITQFQLIFLVLGFCDWKA